MIESSVSFSPLVAKRKKMFSELYTSLILHREITSYIKMLDEVGDPVLLLHDGEVSLSTVNKCIAAIDNSYSHTGFSYLLDSISASILESFTTEQFEFFKAVSPESNDEINSHLFDQSTLRAVEMKLRETFQGYKEICKDLDKIYNDIQVLFESIYFESSKVLTKKSSAANKVGPVVFAWGGTQVGDAMADSIAGKSANDKKVHECMAQVINYFHRVEAFHKLMVTSYFKIQKSFEDISDLFNKHEMDLFFTLAKSNSEMELIFSDYYSTEIEMLEETYNEPIDQTEEMSFREMVDSVHETCDLYNRFNYAA